MLAREENGRGHFPNDDAMKLLYYLNKAGDEWRQPPRKYFEAKTQFAIVFGEMFVCQ
jgi:putative transposase